MTINYMKRPLQYGHNYINNIERHIKNRGLSMKSALSMVYGSSDIEWADGYDPMLSDVLKFHRMFDIPILELMPIDMAGSMTMKDIGTTDEIRQDLIYKLGYSTITANDIASKISLFSPRGAVDSARIDHLIYGSGPFNERISVIFDISMALSVPTLSLIPSDMDISAAEGISHEYEHVEIEEEIVYSEGEQTTLGDFLEGIDLSILPEEMEGENMSKINETVDISLFTFISQNKMKEEKRDDVMYYPRSNRIVLSKKIIEKLKLESGDRVGLAYDKENERLLIDRSSDMLLLSGNQISSVRISRIMEIRKMDFRHGETISFTLDQKESSDPYFIFNRLEVK